MPTRPIKIIGSNTSTGNLELDDHGHTIANPGDTILWQIQNTSGVESIISIQEKSASANIWSTPPHAQGNIWTGEISSIAPAGAIYNYSIAWLAKGAGGAHIYDPIISIKPSGLHFIAKLVTAFLVLLGFSYLMHLRMKRKKK
ncbi:MAG: hypothetical protein JWQ09_3838 [Segetibacter sp.]|nr:hypothetical protein [Segetibacter sp.]